MVKLRSSDSIRCLLDLEIRLLSDQLAELGEAVVACLKGRVVLADQRTDS